MPAVGIPKLRGFPQVCAGCAACRCFWLNDSEEVDWTSTRWISTRQKPLLASWVYFDRQRYSLGLPRIAQGLDRLESSPLSVSTWPPTRPRDLVPDVIDIDGPVPACGEPAGLLMSAEQV
jgi:hypothetical protein